MSDTQLMQMNQLREKKQDAKTNQVLDNLGKAKNQALNIGQEVGRQNNMLEEMVEGADEVNERMKKTESRLDRFVMSSSDSKVYWYIVA